MGTKRKDRARGVWNDLEVQEQGLCQPFLRQPLRESAKSSRCLGGPRTVKKRNGVSEYQI